MNKELTYIIVGISGVLASGGISIITGNIWTGFITAIFVGILYLIFLDRKRIRTLEKPDQKIVLRVLIVALVTVQCSAVYVIYNRAQFMQKNLEITRSSIDEGVSKMQTQDALLDVFMHYYSQDNPSYTTLESSFRSVMGDRLQEEENTIDFSQPNVQQDIIYTYEILSPDKVMITASAEIGMGQNPDFINVTDQTGKYQASAILTPDGIVYEREN